MIDYDVLFSIIRIATVFGVVSNILFLGERFVYFVKHKCLHIYILLSDLKDVYLHAHMYIFNFQQGNKMSFVKLHKEMACSSFEM